MECLFELTVRSVVVALVCIFSLIFSLEICVSASANANCLRRLLLRGLGVTGPRSNSREGRCNECIDITLDMMSDTLPPPTNAGKSVMLKLHVHEANNIQKIQPSDWPK